MICSGLSQSMRSMGRCRAVSAGLNTRQYYDAVQDTVESGFGILLKRRKISSAPDLDVWTTKRFARAQWLGRDAADRPVGETLPVCWSQDHVDIRTTKDKNQSAEIP